MINKLLNPGIHQQKIDYALLFLRITIGVLMLTHGIGKFVQLLGNQPIQFADPIGIGETASLTLAVFAEVFCSIFLILGMATRLAIIPLFTTMVVAVLVVHSGDVFRVKEMALLYLAVFITIGITGAGKISIDNLIYKKFN